MPYRWSKMLSGKLVKLANKGFSDEKIKEILWADVHNTLLVLRHFEEIKADVAADLT